MFGRCALAPHVAAPFHQWCLFLGCQSVIIVRHPPFEAWCLRSGARKRVGERHGSQGFPRASVSGTGERSAASVDEPLQHQNMSQDLCEDGRQQKGKGLAALAN